MLAETSQFQRMDPVRFHPDEMSGKSHSQRQEVEWRSPGGERAEQGVTV